MSHEEMSLEETNRVLNSAYRKNEVLRLRAKDYRAVALKLLNGDKKVLAVMYQKEGVEPSSNAKPSTKHIK